MDTKHTPGPWRTGREDMQSYDGDTGEPFASVYCDDDRAEFHLGQKLPYGIARTFGDECKANARLIAAAPDLLKACKMFVEWYAVDSTEFRRDEAFEAAKAAIEKAVQP